MMNDLKRSLFCASLAIALTLPASCMDSDSASNESYQAYDTFMSDITTRFLNRDMGIKEDLENWYNDVNLDRITIRPYTNEDRAWSLEVGVNSYLQIYDNETYFVNKMFVPKNLQRDNAKSKYMLLGPDDYETKKETLINEGNVLINFYLENRDNRCRSIVLQFDGEDIAGIFYRLYGNSILVVDEFVTKTVDEERKYFIFGDIYKNLLRKLEPTYKTHKICARHVNAVKLEFFTSAGYTLDNAKTTQKYWDDSMLFTGLSKTYS